ncbi:kinase-like protein [Favolaschia claudopus]|uniref:Kinase-like protein n=1 Tax=Favolaschia claudopus TaxID=2862362 RepID=A0AAV9Z872_9AGAR
MITPQTVLDVILGITPVPGLSAAFTLLKFIVSNIEGVSRSKRRLAILAQAASHLLQTLNTELRAGRLAQSTCAQPLDELHSLLIDIESFVRAEQARTFIQAVWTYDTRMDEIDGFHRRLGALADAFQISALLNIQRMLSGDHLAYKQQSEAANVRIQTQTGMFAVVSLLCHY